MSSLRTLSDLVFHLRDTAAGRPVLVSIDRDGRREELSTADFISGIHALALQLENQGVARGTRVALLSENRPDWHIVDFACHLLGAVPVPIYPTSNADQIGYILRNSGSEWVFASGRELRDKVRGLLRSLPREPKLVVFDDDAVGPEIPRLVELQAQGAREITSRPLERMRGRVEPKDLASLIYTSGTTGEPKGVMLTHGNVVSNVLACSPCFDLGPTDQALSFLPLTHVFERTVDYLFFYRGVSIHYSPVVERVPQLLPLVRPTVLTSVPRVYERYYLKASAAIEKENPRRRRLSRWALRVGARRARRAGAVGPLLALQHAVAERLVLHKLRAFFGGRLLFAITGGAPLTEQVEDFFAAAGFSLYQGYGLTETSPVIAVCHARATRRRSVGRTVAGVELRIAQDGESLVRGPGVMEGYWQNPQATAEVFTADHFLRTGDIGHLDREGYLFITDRKKDLLITSGGKNVAPSPIEQLLCAQPEIAQAVVVGDNYPYLTALLVPRYEELPEPLCGLPREQVAHHPELNLLLRHAVDRVNSRLAEHERVRRFSVLERELTVDAGEITPTLKVRRRIVMRRFAERIDAMYLKTQKSQAPATGAL